MDKTARVWDAATGKPVASPLEHHGAVTSAAFSPDGTRVVTASMDKTARVWDAATGRPLTGPLAHHGLVRTSVFSSDGTRVVTASQNGTALVWDVQLAQGMAAEWSAIMERSPFVLVNGALFRRGPSTEPTP